MWRWATASRIPHRFSNCFCRTSTNSWGRTRSTDAADRLQRHRALPSLGSPGASTASPRRLKPLSDGFRELLGYREGTHVDDEPIDLAIVIEVYLIDRLKLLTFDLALKAKEVPIASCIGRQGAIYSG